MLIVLSGVRIACSEENLPDTSVVFDHSPAAVAQAGQWTPLTAKVLAASKIRNVRLYFKTMAGSWFVYVPMHQQKDTFSAQLPPARNSSRGIDYFMIISVEDGRILKTKDYRVLVQDAYDSKKEESSLAVFAELPAPPTVLNDFAITLDVSPSDDPMLAKSEGYQHEPIDIPGPAARSGGGSILGGIGSAAISITAGSVGIQYRTSSGN